MNKNIKEAKRKFEILLIVLMIFQIFFLVIINIFINKFSSEIGFSDIDFQLIKKILIMIGSIIFIIIDMLFFRKFIYRLHTMIDIEPRSCIIEDFILYPYGKKTSGDIRRTDYRISPLIRDLENNKLYFTYGDYSLSYYTVITTRMNNLLPNMTILRKDGSEVKIGDTALFYIKRIVDVNVDIDEEKEIIKLNNERVFNLEENINKFYEVDFFEGIVEVNDIYAIDNKE